MMVEDIQPSREENLHERWRSGDRRAGAELIVEYQGRLRGLGKRLGLPWDLVHDFTQQTLLEASRSRFECRGAGSYWAWLAAIGKHTAARLRQKPRVEAPLPRRYTTPWSGTCRREMLEAIAGMPSHYRVVFERLVTGETPAEVAEALDMRPSTVHMRIHRGRQWLRARGH